MTTVKTSGGAVALRIGRGAPTFASESLLEPLGIAITCEYGVRCIFIYHYSRKCTMDGCPFLPPPPAFIPTHLHHPAPYHPHSTPAVRSP